MSEINDLVERWSEELERIYNERTAGDFTFIGVLATFGQELLALTQGNPEKASESPAEDPAEDVRTINVRSFTDPYKMYEVGYKLLGESVLSPREAVSCTCLDHQTRKSVCKHMRRISDS